MKKVMEKGTIQMLLGSAITGLIVLALLVIYLLYDNERRLTIDVLTSQTVQELATHEVLTNITAERKDHSVWFGVKRDILLAKVRILYGVDFSDVGVEDIERSENNIKLNLPEPRALAVTPDLSSLRYFSDGTMLQYAKEAVTGENAKKKLRAIFEKEARKYAKSQEIVSNNSVKAQIQLFLSSFVDREKENIRIIWNKTQ